MMPSFSIMSSALKHAWNFGIHFGYRMGGPYGKIMLSRNKEMKQQHKVLHHHIILGGQKLELQYMDGAVCHWDKPNKSSPKKR